ncbi:hypothetical protein TW95_gp1037 [Pandoravirus inopinatum]|uniref:Uncharacterized protein n=1 Tax=Pandoravirus inopinatum TaxID=1605721 RepID=A0A0B5JA55_9VIRU|nr:hypothetical protein TW95_gp1037 [Pandoravirus inopinatum]AJF97771.1 hypothetical protein [Pandoravirus inopinatum]
MTGFIQFFMPFNDCMLFIDEQFEPHQHRPRLQSTNRWAKAKQPHRWVWPIDVRKHCLRHKIRPKNAQKEINHLFMFFSTKKRVQEEKKAKRHTQEGKKRDRHGVQGAPKRRKSD